MEIKKTWNKQYKKNTTTALQDKNLFKLEIDSIKQNFKKKISELNGRNIKILEIGSGTGYLALQLTKILKNENISYEYTGIDFSTEAIKKSKKRKISNCAFFEIDFLKFFKTNTLKFDLIISQRSIMAMMNKKTQKELLNQIKLNLKKSGFGIFSECTIQSLKNHQKLRKKLSIEPYEKIWHSTYIDENTLKLFFKTYQKIDFSSSYYLITRIIYPYFSKPKHNTKIHDFASSLDQHGDYSLVKLFIVKN